MVEFTALTLYRVIRSISKGGVYLEITEELIITELVVNGGNARGLAIEAIKAARNRDLTGPKKSLLNVKKR